MNYESFTYSGVKTIDYRNARYQGLVSKDNKRQGFGLLLDDDMNLYCSEWNKGQMSGKTLILLRSGRYIYGNWHQGEPHGAISFKSKKTILFGNYYKGKTKESMVSFYEPTNNVLCFYAEEMQKKSGLQLVSCQTLNDLQNYEQYLSEVATKRCGILTNIDEITMLDFMRKLAAKNDDFLVFKQKGQILYFGFENGIGVKFTVSGAVSQHINQISIGNHASGQKLLQIGAKYYKQPDCTEQGNFQTRQLISYNKYNQRPQQKCHLIFQNTHRKGLYFRNEYFDAKLAIICTLQQFCSRKLTEKCEQIQAEMKESVKSSHLKRTDSNLISESKSGHKKTEMLRQKSAQNINLISQKSAKNLVIAQDRNKTSLSKRHTYTEQQAAVNELIKNYNELRYKKAHHCDRSFSKTISPSKSTSKLSKPRQKSKDIQRQGMSPLKKQVKYLKHKIVTKQPLEKEVSPLKNIEKNTDNIQRSKEPANTFKNNKLSEKSLNKSSHFQKEQQKSPYIEQKKPFQKYREDEYNKQVKQGKNRKQTQNNIKNIQKERSNGFKMDDMLGLQVKQQRRLSQYQIQRKIRQEILQQEKYRELKTRPISQFLYQREPPNFRLQPINNSPNIGLQSISNPPNIWLQSICNPIKQRQSFMFDEVTLSPKQIKRNFQEISTRYIPEISTRNITEISPHKVQEISPRKPIKLKTTTPNFDCYLQDLQTKREKLLREFRQMSQQMQSNLMPERYMPQRVQNDLHQDRLKSHHMPMQTNSIYTQYQSRLKQYHQQQNLRSEQDVIRPKLSNYMYKNSESIGPAYRAERNPLQNTVNSINFDEYEQSRVKEFNNTRKKKYEYLLQ